MLKVDFTVKSWLLEENQKKHPLARSTKTAQAEDTPGPGHFVQMLLFLFFGDGPANFDIGPFVLESPSPKTVGLCSLLVCRWPHEPLVGTFTSWCTVICLASAQSN